ncbi:hypothetical protein TK50_26665 [Micromonospora haikouensis]|uniref:Uncharacterized protein n=1 Tax=Micromonospora haikouensis TaxID=686309 RepID=A0A0D0WRE0_9ACTN|nr:hypothetical protein TK50_26665 [Micromonospora haikouensis]
MRDRVAEVTVAFAMPVAGPDLGVDAPVVSGSDEQDAVAGQGLYETGSDAPVELHGPGRLSAAVMDGDQTPSGMLSAGPDGESAVVRAHADRLGCPRPLRAGPVRGQIAGMAQRYGGEPEDFQPAVPAFLFTLTSGLGHSSGSS